MKTAAKKRHKKKKKVGKGDATQKQIRGSSLLLAGRLLSTVINFASQVLIVRYLTTTDYGSWAYGLSVVAFFHGLSTLGLRRGITRFIPIYHENDERAKLLGTIVLVLFTIVITGVVIIGGAYIAPDLLANLVSGDGEPIGLVLIMVFMIPVQALDGLLIALFASFGSTRSIFVRKYILGPGLKLLVVLLLISFQTSVAFLAYGYISASMIGIMIYGYLFVRVLQKDGTMKGMNFSNIEIPAKEIFAFTIPLMTSDLVNIFMHSADTLLLGYFHDTTQVGAYRAILPASHFNKIVMTSFSLLYMPLAARLFAKKDFSAINDLYWKTAIWMSVLSFPIFALTFSMAKPLTLALFGERYAESWIFLSLLSFGYYFNCILGFNGLTLKVLGKIKYVVIINFVAAAVNITLALILIPKYGALGAAIGTTAAMIIHNILKQSGLRMAAGAANF